MIDPDPTPTQVRHLQNQLKSLLDEKAHRSALKEGAKSWSWEKAKKRLRKKRRAFDHQLVSIYEGSKVPTPDDLHSRFDKVWESEVENPLYEFVQDNVSDKTMGVWGIGQMGLGAVLGLPYLGAMLGGSYVYLISVANDSWKTYCEECVRIAVEEAEKEL